jgi:hypothetical protein
MKITEDISREGNDTVKVRAPEGIVADLFPHFTRAPGHVLEECFCRKVGDPEQDFPDPVSQRRVLQADEQRNGGGGGGQQDAYSLRGYALDENESPELLHILFHRGELWVREDLVEGMSRRRQIGRFAHSQRVWLREKPERRPRARNILPCKCRIHRLEHSVARTTLSFAR